MRTQRPGSRWTSSRQASRAAYRRYMASPAWATRRRKWFQDNESRTGAPASCAVCGTRDRLELHHHDYARLGREDHDDLVALCPAHHRHVHDVYDASRTWRALGRRTASLGIIAAMCNADRPR